MIKKTVIAISVVLVGLVIFFTVSFYLSHTCTKWGPYYTTYIPITHCLVYRYVKTSKYGGSSVCVAYLTSYTPIETRDCLEWKRTY